MIRLENINKTFWKKNVAHKALSQINLAIAQGEIFGIFGKSGAGKSTLLRCLNFLEQPSQGRVLINNTQLDRLTPKELRQKRHKIGMIFQHCNLLSSRTVFDNIALPLELLGTSRAQINQQVNRLLEWVGLEDSKHHFPIELSGGQKQRVAIARALVTDPDILLCDEATSALDSESTKNILDFLLRINRELGLTIVLITHELDVIQKVCDRAGVLDDGQLIEVGSCDDLFTQPKHPTVQSLIKHAFFPVVPPMSHGANSAHAREESSVLIRLRFVGRDSEEPVISHLIKQYDLSVNIVQADISQLKHKTIGFTVCELSGDKARLQKALSYLDHLSVDVKELNHG